MRLFKTPFFIQILFPNILWSVKTNQKIIYLTFDDGPTPVVTPFVLETLDKFEAKATFFCIGHHLLQEPEITHKITKEGHLLANHTQFHSKAGSISTVDFLKEIQACDSALEPYRNSSLFRPPYGKLNFSTYWKVRKFKKIVLWDVLTYDFDAKLSKEVILKNAVKNTKNGSIVVFHDSDKAFENLKYVLSKYLEHFSSLGFSFETLEKVNQNKIN